jgi:hypothetical protein
MLTPDQDQLLYNYTNLAGYRITQVLEAPNSYIWGRGTNIWEEIR